MSIEGWLIYIDSYAIFLRRDLLIMCESSGMDSTWLRFTVPKLSNKQIHTALMVHLKTRPAPGA